MSLISECVWVVFYEVCKYFTNCCVLELHIHFPNYQYMNEICNYNCSLPHVSLTQANITLFFLANKNLIITCYSWFSINVIDLDFRGNLRAVVYKAILYIFCKIHELQKSFSKLWLICQSKENVNNGKLSGLDKDDWGNCGKELEQRWIEPQWRIIP